MASNRQALIKALEALLHFFESTPAQVGASGFLSPQEPVAPLVKCLWNLRRGKVVALHHVHLLLQDQGPLQLLARANNWEPQFINLQRAALKAFLALHQIRYFGSEDQVEPGDHVELRLFFRKVQGQVNYVPGKPEHRSDLDFNGLFNVGINVPERAFIVILVDPDTLELRRSVKLLRRDPANVPALSPKEIEFDN